MVRGNFIPLLITGRGIFDFLRLCKGSEWAFSYRLVCALRYDQRGMEVIHCGKS